MFRFPYGDSDQGIDILFGKLTPRKVFEFEKHPMLLGVGIPCKTCLLHYLNW